LNPNPKSQLGPGETQQDLVEEGTNVNPSQRGIGEKKETNPSIEGLVGNLKRRSRVDLPEIEEEKVGPKKNT